MAALRLWAVSRRERRPLVLQALRELPASPPLPEIQA